MSDEGLALLNYKRVGSQPRSVVAARVSSSGHEVPLSNQDAKREPLKGVVTTDIYSAAIQGHTDH